jgi:PKD repeat protein
VYGSNTKTIAKIIAVGGQPLPFVEDFEDAAYAENWQTENPDNGKTWEIALVGGSQPGNKAISMDFYNYSAIGQLDGFVSPPINLEGFSNINLTFDHAYRKYNLAKNDSLNVYITTDCGTSWSLLQAYGENGTNNWVTGTNTTSAFVPTSAASWCGAAGTASCKTINLNAYAGNDEVRLKFVAKNAFGNNLYLDNINITGTPNVKPIANFIGDTAGCSIGTFAFYDVSANNATSFAWSFPGGSPATSTQANPVVTYTTSGNYTVTLIATNAAGADTIVQTSFVAVSQAVTPTLNITSSATTICDQQLITFTPNVTNAGSNPTYFWYKNGNFKDLNYGPLSITDAQNGDVYKCVLRPDLDCVTNDSVVSNSITITVLPLPTVSLSSFAQVCSSDPAFTLTGGLPVGGTYSGNGVSNGVFDPQIAGVGGHVITYTVNGANGCINQATKNISVENGPPKPSISYNNFVLKASPISSSYTYQWYDAQGNAIAGATDTVYIPWFTGNYTVKLTFVNGCESESDAFTVAQVGMSEHTLAQGLRLYPNPVKDVLHAEIVIQSKTELTLRIFDLAGREIYQAVKVVDAGIENLNISVENLPAGAYIFEVSDTQNVLTNRFIKQ